MYLHHSPLRLIVRFAIAFVFVKDPELNFRCCNKINLFKKT